MEYKKKFMLNEIKIRAKENDIEINKKLKKIKPYNLGDKVLVFEDYANYGKTMNCPKIAIIKKISPKGNFFLDKMFGSNSFTTCFYPSGKLYSEPMGKVWFIPYHRVNELEWVCADDRKNQILEDWEIYPEKIERLFKPLVLTRSKNTVRPEEPRQKAPIRPKGNYRVTKQFKKKI